MSRRAQSPPGLDYEALARELAPRVAQLVLAQLATALGASQAPAYSTRRGHEPAEFHGRAKTWRAVAPGIPGAVRLGRWWAVPRDRYAAWLSAQSATPAPVVSIAPMDSRAVLAAAGIRGTR